MAEEAGAINAYVCQKCGWEAVTKNLVEGTTPFIIGCEREGCNGAAQSQFYRVPQDQPPTHEWYRPTTASERKKLADPALREHVELGGLLLRKVLVVH